MNGAVRTGLALLIAAAVSTGAAGQTPLGSAFTYQGELRQSGAPVTGAADLRFRLYDALTVGTQIGSTIDRPNVALAQGRFTQDLDFGATAFGPDARFLEIDVRSPAGVGSYVTLAPRQRVTPSPAAQFSVQAGNAATAVSATTAASATTATNATQLNGQAASFYQNAANLSSGTLPDARLAGTYSGVLALSNAGNAFTGVFAGGGAGLTGLNASSLALGTLPDARLSSNVALLNNTQTFTGAKTFSIAPSFTGAGSPFTVAGTGLVANLNADRLDGLDSTAFLQSIPVPLTLSGTSATHIIRGDNASAADYSSGVLGLVAGTPTGLDEIFGVWGEATAPSGYTYGLWGEVASTAGTGGLGCATATTGFTWGLVGLSFSSGGTGVYGAARASGGTTYGVWGTSLSAAGYGVYGSASGGTQNAGVYGNSSAFNGNGIIGEALSGGSAFGLWAKAPQGTGVYCQGALTVTGTKAFRIDHPSDPENQYLIHYCSEGPEPLNVYRGNVVTDASGYAVIALPSYFEEINRDVSYQLTVIDNSDDFVLAKVAEGVRDNSFTVRTSKPNVRVSWEVKGVRNDLYTRHYGAPVEVNKTDKDRGTYQHPELYGQPKERMFGYVPESPPPRRPRQ